MMLVCILACAIALQMAFHTHSVAAAQGGSGATAHSGSGSGSGTSPFTTQKEKLSYAIGVTVGTNVAQGLKAQDIDADEALILRGIKDTLANKQVMSEEEVHAVLTQMQKDAAVKRQEKAEASKKEGETFLATNKTKAGVTTLPSGLQYKILKEGTGPKPTTADTVVCNYKGTLIDGSEFDSSYKRGEPATFPVTGVIKGWTEALQLMPVGSKWQLFVPADLAYGERGRPGIPPNAVLIFEVELVSIKPAATPEPVTPVPTPTPAK